MRRYRPQRFRVFVALLVLITAFLVLLGRVVYLQIVQHDKYLELADNNRIDIRILPPQRGQIFDRNGVLLAGQKPSYQLVVKKELADQLDSDLERLKTLGLIDNNDIQYFSKIQKRYKKFHPIPVKTGLDEHQAYRFASISHQFKGFDLEASEVRYYPFKASGVHFLGYVGRINDQDLKTIDPQRYQGTRVIGKNGVEKYYESQLHGQPGFQKVETNVQGRTIRILEQTPPINGQNVTLTIDIRLQHLGEELLKGERGSIVLMDNETGDILAFVSQPTFDPNLFVNGISGKDYQQLLKDPNKPFLNRALRGQYPPGSTFKPFVALAGLEQNYLNPTKKFFAGPYFQLPNSTHKYRDWKKQGHGWVDLNKSMAQSCDVYFYDLATRMGITKIHDFIQPFGFGQTTGIDLLGEKKGLLPSREWKKAVKNQPWYRGETVITGIGQGYTLATPLQLAASTAALANSGFKVKPRINLQSPSQGEQLTVKNHHNWKKVVESMVAVVHSPTGTARKLAKGLDYKMAGKSGTAQVFGIKQGEEYDAENLKKRLRDHALFTAFAPAEKPEVTVAVIVENGESGSGVAGPIAKAMIEKYFELKP